MCVYYTLIIVSFCLFLGVDKAGVPNYSFSIRWLSATNHTLYSWGIFTFVFSARQYHYYGQILKVAVGNTIQQKSIVRDYTDAGVLMFHWELTVKNNDSCVSVIVTWQQSVLIVKPQSFSWTPSTESNIFSFSRTAYLNTMQEKLKPKCKCRQRAKYKYVQTILI